MAFGLYDMSGNLFEWCTPEKQDPSKTKPCRGGSWAERDPTLLTVFRRVDFPADYQGLDVGFRVVLEEAKSKP